jgi:hypothetical protein
MPGVYFCVKMIEYTEDIFEGETNLGRTFLYDRYADRCVAVPNVLFRMLDGARLEDVVSEAADHE